MLAANTAVAEELLERDIPGLFRVHAEPKDDDLQEFRAWTADVLGVSVKRLVDRDKLNSFLASLADSPLKEVVLSAFLRVMPRAGYSEACTGHFGLGKERYAHFTSPIRRYPDLLVHQQLLNADMGRSVRSQQDCAEIGAHCTDTESNIDSAYYAAVDRLKIRYVEQQRLSSSGVCYEASVCRLLSDGLLMYIPELGMQGFLPGRSLSDGPYRLNRATKSFRSSRSGKNYKCGDVMYVQVRRADTVRGELSLEPLQARV
jgi:ribonuclease R